MFTVKDDPHHCRRALREIGEIVSVAILPDSQMSDQEALQDIAAIAGCVHEEAPGGRADCSDLVRSLADSLAGIDFEALDDRAALKLFSRVLGALETSDSTVFPS